jgi:hypothetical protein
MSAVAIGASLMTSFNATPALAIGTSRLVSAAMSTSFSASTPTLGGRNMAVSAAMVTSFAQAPITIGGRQMLVSASMSTSFSASLPDLAGRSIQVAAQLTTSFSASVNLTGASDTHGLSACDVVSNLLGVWGIFCRKTAPQYAIDHAVGCLNHALQLVWNNADGRSYWSNETITIDLADGESSQDLADDIQNVVGPCRLESNRQPLTIIGTIGELEVFSDAYLDGATADVPVAYHIERLAQSATDPAKCVFHVNQPVTGTVGFLLEVVKEAPRFTSADMSSCPLIPIPHRYVESLLLPVARYQASAFYLFRQDALKPTIDREYQQAMVSLGLADPLPAPADNQKRTPE